MKKVCIVFNHLQVSDGVARSAVAIANCLAKVEGVEVILRPAFICTSDTDKLLRSGIKVKPLFGFYFRGLAKIIEVLPGHLLHYVLFGRDKYHLEIGFQYGIATKSVVLHGKDTAKHFVWMHGYDEGLRLEKYYTRADKVICVSKVNADRLKNELSGKVKIEYCYNPIDEKEVQKLGLEKCDIAGPKQKLLFVTVGRHSQEKGYIRLLEIVYRLKCEGYDFMLWLVGDGPLHDELIEKAKRLEIEDFLLFTGEQTNPYKFMAKADVFVCSSYAEGYSTVCTEASMLGIPILTTDVSGGHEIIETAGAGRVVDVDDEALYRGMKDILDDPDIVKEWKQILGRTKENFAAAERIRKLLKVLELEEG